MTPFFYEYINGTVSVAKCNHIWQNGTSKRIRIIFCNSLEVTMATAVKVSDELIAKARIRSKIFKRSIAGQIEFWAKMGELAEENPDLPLSLIQDILLGKEQIKAGEGTPYVFGEGE